VDTNSHYERLLLDALDSVDDPELAYQSRARLRRALLALKRGPNGINGIPPASRSATVSAIVERLEERVLSLAQPSESLDMRWRNDWAAVSSDIAELRQAISVS
jgi:hypothetical protein